MKSYLSLIIRSSAMILAAASCGTEIDELTIADSDTAALSNFRPTPGRYAVVRQVSHTAPDPRFCSLFFSDMEITDVDDTGYTGFTRCEMTGRQALCFKRGEFVADLRPALDLVLTLRTLTDTRHQWTSSTSFHDAEVGQILCDGSLCGVVFEECTLNGFAVRELQP